MAKKKLLRQQRAWAKSYGLEPDSRGYVAQVDANLRKPFSPSTLAAFEAGSGAELEKTATRPPKMCALHSSAVLAVNVFDHWVREDPAPLLAALDIESSLKRPIAFEAQFPTGLTGNPPTLDVVLELASGQVVGIESKFTEWLTPKRTNKPALKEKYFEGGAQLWKEAGLPGCQALAHDLEARTESYRFLDAAQLLKHALGLATQSPNGFALFYLYFDVPGRWSAAHREELARFAGRTGRELGFKQLTYQALYRELCARPEVDADYVGYLGARYFPESRS